MSHKNQRSPDTPSWYNGPSGNGYTLAPISETTEPEDGDEQLELVAQDLEQEDLRQQRLPAPQKEPCEPWNWRQAPQAWQRYEERALFLTLFWPRFLFGAYGCFVLLCVEYTLEYHGHGLLVALGPLASDTSGFVWSQNLASWLESRRPGWFSTVATTVYSPERRRAIQHTASVLGVACGNLIVVCVFAFFGLILRQ